MHAEGAIFVAPLGNFLALCSDKYSRAKERRGGPIRLAADGT
jgi:hypothetical protein